VKGLVELLRANPARYNYGSSGVGSMLHLCGDMLSKEAGASMTHVPYRGAAPETIGLLAGEVLTGFNGITAILPQVREGTLRALAVGTPARSAALPDVPTMREAGYPHLDCYSWVAFFAPAKTSPQIIARLVEAKNRALDDPAVSKRVQEVGIDPAPGTTPAQLATFLREQLAVWTPIIKATGVEMD
jgi:tripartite-type tricarboxylate transporter receptor subunit TctC